MSQKQIDFDGRRLTQAARNKLIAALPLPALTPVGERRSGPRKGEPINVSRAIILAVLRQLVDRIGGNEAWTIRAARLAEDTGHTRASVSNALTALRNLGVLTAMRARGRRTTTHSIDWARIRELGNAPDGQSPAAADAPDGQAQRAQQSGATRLTVSHDAPDCQARTTYTPKNTPKNTPTSTCEDAEAALARAGVKLITLAIEKATSPTPPLTPYSFDEVIAFCEEAARAVPANGDRPRVPAYDDPGHAVFRRIANRTWDDPTAAYEKALAKRREAIKRALSEVGRADEIEIEHALADHLAGRSIKHYLTPQQEAAQ